MKNSFLQLAIEQKNLSTQAGATLKIRGMASTKNLDRYNEIVEPSAFLDSIDLFMKNPVMLLQHNMNKPIGRFTSLNMTADGLEVEGEVLHNDDGVIDKIKSGVLQAFSVGFIPKKYEVKDEKGNLLATEEEIEGNVNFAQLFNNKNIKTITELELVEISVVSIPSNVRSLFGVTESATKFFDNLQKDWAAEIKTLENSTENEAENPEEAEQNEIENTDIPVSGHELRDTDNVANEIISEIPETTETDEKNSVASDKSSEVGVQNNENIHKNIYDSDVYQKLFDEKTKITEIAKNLVFELEKVLEENAELKNILKNTPVRKGIVNIGGQIQPKEKSFIEKLIDEAKAVLGLTTSSVEAEEKMADAVETKAANDVMHTQNVGHGKELVQQEVFANTIIDETIRGSALLSSLPGYHGTNLPSNLVVPVIGDLGYMQNAPEYTATNGNLPYSYSLPNTGNIRLKSEKLIITVPVSYEMLERGVGIEQYIRSGVANSWARTCESILLNADDTTGTNNINTKGENVQAGDKRHWFRPAGVRKTAIDQGNTKDLGVIDESDLFDMVALLGDKAAQPADCVWVMNRATALKISQIPSLKNQYQNGRSSTIVKGAETNVLASDIFITREIANATDDGKVSKTASENTKGQIVYMHKSAPQFGYDNLRIEVIRVGGHGYAIIATTYFGHAIASGLLNSDKSVALGVNVSL